MERVLFVPNQLDVVKWILFDTLTLPNNSAGLRTIYYMFAEPISDKKGSYETNLILSSQLPFPQHFEIQKILVKLASSNGAEANETFAWNTNLSLLIGQKSYLNMALSTLLPIKWEPNEPGDDVYDITLGGIDVSELPLTIMQGMFFRAELKIAEGLYLPRTSGQFKIAMLLYGTLYRPV